MKYRTALVAVLMMLGVASVSQAAIVVNGGFDWTPHTDGAYHTITDVNNPGPNTQMNWTGSGNNTAIYDPDSTRVTGQNGTNDVGYIFITEANSPVALQQTLGITLTSNTIFTLTVDVAADVFNFYPFPAVGNGVSTGDVFTRLLANGGAMPGYVSSTATQPAIAAPFITWTIVWQTGANAPLAGAALTVDLSVTGPANHEAYFDNVSLTTAAAPVPEPASLSLLAVGGLLALRRSRRAHAA